MQPPPRTGLPGASGPPPSGAGPNAFRRNRPHKHTSAAASAAAMSGPPPPAQPMTDPFAFVRQAPPPMDMGGHPMPPNSSHSPMQAPHPGMFSQPGAGPGMPSQPLEGGAQALPPPSSTPGVSLFTPHSTASPVPFPGQLPYHPPPGPEQGYFNSRDPTPSVTPGPPPLAPAPLPGQAPYIQGYQGNPSPQTVPCQLVPPSSNQWAPDQVNRPPSVQNYFQPTSDPPPQSFNNPPKSNMAPHPHSPHHPPPTPPHPHPHSYPNPQPPPQHSDRPSSSQWTDPGGPANSPQQHNSHFQAQSYFSQSSGPQDWFNQPLQESAYHQMGAGPGSGSGLGLTRHDSGASHQGATPSLAHYTQDSGTISMFFKGNDVENEETLAGEGQAVNGIQGHPEDHLQQQHPHTAPGPEVLQGYRGAPAHAEPSVPYMNDGNYAVPPMNPHAHQPTEPQFDHVENLECVPNQEVLPSEPQSSPASQGGDRYEPGPNLETPDSVARPMRSASVSSSYSNVSHGSGTGPGPRRHQGVVGTFIQQESPRPSDDALSSAAAGGYFEQIDTSPAGDVAGAHHQSPQERMYHSQTPTPSPPKPIGIFQASANSSFEPVRSHSVGVRPAEVDRARMVAERGTDAVSGNLEQPPDNLENVYGAGAVPVLGPGPGAGLPLLTHPLGLPHSRPSSRAHVAQRPCESPATTLWAQNDPASLGASILLAPAAPPVHAPLREPSSEVIQPPEDGPLDLQPLQRASENMENPPQVSEGPPEPQAHMGYASLLVADSLHQPILIAPPASNYSVIAPQAANLSSPRETTPPVRPPSQPPSANPPPLGPLPLTFNPNQIFAPPPVSFSSAPTGQSPLNLARDSRDGVKQEPPPPLTQFCPPLSRGQSVGGDSHASLPVNSHAPPAATAASSTNHNPPSNFELLDFSMHQSQIPNQAICPPPTTQVPPLASNAPGFYLQVTKDARQGALSEQTAPPAPALEPVPSPATPSVQQAVQEPLKAQDPRQGPQSQTDTALALTTAAPPSLQRQHPPPAQGPPAGNGPQSTAAYPTGPPGQVLPSTAAYPPGPPGQVPPSTAAYPSGPPGQVPPVNPQQQPGPPQPGTQPAPNDPPRPPSSLGSQQGYGPLPPVPGQVYGGYYGGTYPEYPDARAAYPPGQYPPPPVDPRAQQYYPDDPYRRADPRYPRYEGPNPAYRDPGYREPPAERPSSRTSQYSDRPSSRQGYPEDYQRANRSAYDDYYAEYYKKQYDYGDRSRWEGYNTAGAYDPRYHGYYDQSYWYNYDPEAYRARDPYYQQAQQQQPPQQPQQQQQQPYPARREGYEDPWRYYPGYDSSFDDDYRRQRDAYGEEFDRRSFHSEQSAHSIHSSHSHHSRRSSFSSRSQQSQVYRSQPDLVAAAYDATSSTLAADYSYAQYPDQADATQNYGQYPYTGDYTTEGTWPAAEQPPPRPVTPEKYSVPHRCARFGPGGQLIQVLPNLPSAGQPALVEIHNMETMLQDSSDQAELRTFPGPLVREETHKVDVIKFAQNKAMECSRSNDLVDKDSACLLWDFIVLLCRQNGTVVGTDIADLLLKEHRSVWLPGKSPNEANLIDFNNEPLAHAEEEPGAGPLSLLSDTLMTVPENVGKETERFRELLLFGRKKDALEAAMKVGLWGHALLLASKMDNRTHARVMTRFANSLPINDPLQTVYQLMSGRMPASATCCGDEKWGDWRPHLAMVLSNLTHTLDLDTRTITTMGDTLASKGLFDAAHFCYLMAQVGLGVFTKKSTKMVLVGSNHSLPFYQFATNEAIQRTEAYEYAQSLGSQPVSLPNFQVFKLVYACRLAEAGLCAQAFHYCEVISRTVLMQPSYHSPVFISQLIQMSEKLRFFDPQLKERPEQELFNEPDWLIHLRQLDGQIRTGVISYNADRATPQPYDCSTPSSELDQASPSEPYASSLEMEGATPNNPLMSSLLPGPSPQAVQLMPPAPTNILQDGLISQPQPSSDGIQLYPAAPSLPGPGPGPTPGYSPQAHGFAAPYQHQPSPQQHLPPEHAEMYPGQQTGPPQMGQPPPPQMGQPPPPQMQHPLPPPQQQPQVVPQQMLSHMYPPGEPSMPPPQDLQQPCPMPASPVRNTFTPQMDFYDQMAHMGPGRRSRTTSQSSMHMGPPGRRSRTVSESSTHSGGRERSNSAVKQSSPAPPSIPEQPRKAEPKKPKKDSPKKGGGGGGGGGWLNWLYRKGKNEAHLPDDKNKSIVWDEDKQKWVNMEEPEEESKPPPPPPSGFPKMAPMAGPPGGPGAPPGGGPPVNMFSRRAGTKSRYVDVMNPGGRSGPKPGGSIPAPADLFAPLAPMPMPANLFVPGAASEEQQPMEGSVPEMGASQEQGAPNPSAVPQMFNPTLLPPGPEGPAMLEGTRSGELSRSSSMSSLSREVSQHLNQAPPAQGAPPSGGVTFYNPAQFAQASAPSGPGRQRLGRLGGQREYPTLK